MLNVNIMENTNLRSTTEGWVWDNIYNFCDAQLDNIKAMPETELFRFLQNCGLISSFKNCPDCNELLTILQSNTSRNPFFRCKKSSCRRQRLSAFKNSIFEQSKLPLKKILSLLYNFCCRRSVADSAETLEITKKTVIDVYKFFRSAVSNFVERKSEKLGGNGIVIHFDETPITHRHGLTGRHNRSNTVWVVGAVDIFSRKCFLKFLPSRSRSDLFHFFTTWILPGSVVHTDCHRSYNTLNTLGFTHFTVNHSRNLVSPDGIHTNWIEGLFGCVKKLIRKYDAGLTTG
ncbi:hypothetical protein H311_01380 [Anncaliia algerae PRA109]|nr:hypothetical protein H311_01380 [Anncaliia algerae PRA109]